MSESTQSVQSSHRTPLLTHSELISIATLVCGTLFAIVVIACRWLIEYRGEGLNLLLVAGGFSAALILLGRVRAGKTVDLAFSNTFAVSAIAALVVWSPGFAFAVLVTAPIAGTLTIPVLLNCLGYELRLQDSGGVSTDLRSRLAPVPDKHDSTSSINPEQELAAVGEEAIEEDCENDPWTVVQNQFRVDETLTQNVAQWAEADGTRCVVANVRCRFSQPNETRIVHLPFWPILDNVPAVYCRVASGPDAKIKTTQEYPHGLRLEVRLADQSTLPRDDTIVEVVASDAANGSSERAA